MFTAGGTITYKPWSFFDANKPVGIDADVTAYIADKLGVKPQMVDTDWAGVVASLNAGKFDAIVSALTATDERYKAITFTQPYGSLQWVMLVKAISGFTSVADLEGKTIATEQGGAQEPILQSWIDAGHKFKMLSINGLDNVYAALAAGRADALMDGLPGVLYFIKNNPAYKEFPATPADQTEKNTWTVIGVSRANLDLCNFINDTMTEMKQNGKMKEIQDKWLGSYMDTPPQVSEFQACK